MGRYLCQLCYTVVRYGERHPCFFYKDEDTVYILPQLHETEVDRNYDETTGELAENSEDDYWNKCEESQPTKNTSQASAPRFNSVFFTRNEEVDGGLLEVSRCFRDERVTLQTSFSVPSGEKKLESKRNQRLDSKQDAGAEEGPSSLRPHSTEHDGYTRCACNLCSYKSERKTDLDVHHRKHSGDKSYVCDTCDKSFSQKGNLTRHAKAHTGEKPYVCDYCGRSFSLKYNLTKHARVHTDEKPYECYIYRKCFRVRESLNLHMRTHTGEKPYSCDICGRSFSDGSSCRRHVLTHDGEKRYKCDICGRKQCKCTVCGKAFSSNSNRNRHIREKHQ